MMNEISRMEGLISHDKEDAEQEFIKRNVFRIQQKMNDEAFLVEERARGDYSGCLIEVENRIKNMMNENQYALFKEMRQKRDAFPWPPVDIDE